MFHSLLQTWFNWVHDWGYIGIFFLMTLESSIVPIPSEIILPPAAFWAAQGKLNFFGVVLAGTFGSYFGSVISYWLAIWLGRPLIHRYGSYFFMSPSKLSAAEKWIAHYGGTGIFIARLLPVIRHLVSIPAGLLRMPFGTFSITTILGAFTWCLVLSWFGKETIGANPEILNSPEALWHGVKSDMGWFVAAVLLIAVLYFVYVLICRKFSAKPSVK